MRKIVLLTLAAAFLLSLEMPQTTEAASPFSPVVAKTTVAKAKHRRIVKKRKHRRIRRIAATIIVPQTLAQTITA